MKRRRFPVLLVVLLALAGSAYAARYPFLRFMATHLVAEDPLEKADAIFVLAGDTPRRVIEAANLYKGGYAPLVLLAHDEEEPGFETLRKMGIGPDRAPSRNDMNLSLAVVLGIPASRVKLSPYVTTRTANEATAAARWVREIGGIRKLLLVTSQSHTRRAGKIFRRAFEGSFVGIRVHGDRLAPLDPENWWRVNYQRRAVGYEWMVRAAAPFIGSRD
jgi:uncharacterized SAM-binding protein YcdF (DUF218 family)